MKSFLAILIVSLAICAIDGRDLLGNLLREDIATFDINLQTGVCLRTALQDIVVRYPQLAEWQAELLVTLRPLFVELVRCRPNDIVCQEEVQERIVKIVLEHVDKLQDDEETAGAWEEVNEAVQKCLE